MGLRIPFLQKLQTIYGFSGEAGFAKTNLPNVRFFWTAEPLTRTPLIYEAGIVFVIQGCKIGYHNSHMFRYDVNNYMVLTVPIPFECEAHASPDNALVEMFVDIDKSTLHELTALVEKHRPLQEPNKPSARHVIEPIALDVEMAEATKRLLMCLRSPLESEVLGPPLVREVIYRALLGERGKALYELTQHNYHCTRVARALTRIHSDYADPLSVELLAEDARMSVSAFHRAFKQSTADSPLQYLKKIRLNKAKSLIMHEDISVGQAAQQVGYESASQFSREFKRYFQVAPIELRKVGDHNSTQAFET